MSTRYRWFRLRLPISPAELHARISTSRFSPDARSGFAAVSSESDGEPAFRFLWRSKVLVTRLSDDGTPNTEEVESLDYTDFKLIELGEAIFLRVENPGRSVRDLMNALELMAGMGFTSKSVQFDQARPSTFFASLSTSKLVGLKVVGAVVADDLVARMEFASKEGMDPTEMQVLHGLKYRVELAVYEVIHQGIRGQVSFASSGMVKISGQIAPRLISLIEADLPTLVG